eukprot:CAMPEP_0174372608 /NCGR_PEP_ID=MMETSP0811_2-20130205/104207_1 /TAXON_ID=73025 ORGANISM="Eutreptiella gymnastica-like, Strain CCMP1594" /NCGR_SAMPLE_ID=MMETSP0811_2 /ASSEMBLY_ACC=CAM_ASM_000667 /LENGTH=35 /DNA_ID= /DNA_START= /DNA_END= /DNA_ORIENTATION=
MAISGHVESMKGHDQPFMNSVQSIPMVQVNSTNRK